jgi:hypothetical protein
VLVSGPDATERLASGRAARLTRSVQEVARPREQSEFAATYREDVELRDPRSA